MYTEDEIIDGLKQKSEKVISYLYERNFTKATKILARYGADDSNAQIIFNDALLAGIDNVIQGKFKKDSKFETYLMSIAKIKWLRECKRKNLKYVELEEEVVRDLESSQIEDDGEEFKTEMTKKVMTKMNEMGEACQKILVAYYYNKVKLKDLATEMGYTSSFIRVKKIRCLKKLKSLIEIN